MRSGSAVRPSAAEVGTMTVVSGNLVARARAAQRGMTLIEIMVVILIMGLIMGTVGYAVFRYLRRSEIKTTRMKVQRVLDAVQEYQADPDTKQQGDGDCPSSLQVLVPERVKPDMIKDAWNQPLKIVCQGPKICIYSIGKNKRDENGGGDDIKACTEDAGDE
jgi:prepilin-type N-terminal cleavage/methylation domain-containing protein